MVSCFNVAGQNVEPTVTLKDCYEKEREIDFLVPQGGAMTVTEYCHTHLFRPGLLSAVWYFVRIQPCEVELQQLLFSGEQSIFTTLPDPSTKTQGFE